MESYAMALVILLIVAVVGFFSVFLIKYYVDSSSSALTTGVAALGIFVALFCVMLVPVDVYTVSSSLNSDGSQVNPDLVNQSAYGIKILYYILYSVLLFVAFILMPFAYFYFEEEYEESSVSGRACAASKYTIAFLIVFVVLLALGIVLRTEKGSNDWKSTLSSDFDAGDAILTFSIGGLATLGLFSWIPYAGYGLAALPIGLIRGDSNKRADSEEGLIQKEEDPEAAQKKNTEQLNWLKASNPGPMDEWTQEDRKKLRTLEREHRQLEQKRLEKSKKRGTITSTSGSNETTRRVMSCWTCCTPFRFVLGIAFIAVSLLIIVSLVMSTVDKFLHSECGPGCGYTLSQTHLQNPIDLFLNILSTVFPLDFVFYAFFIVYIFMCAISGLVHIGVRCCLCKLFTIRPGKTPPNAMILGAWLLMFVVLVLNMQILTLSPQYSSFGTQFYYPILNGTEVVNGTTIISPGQNITFSTQKQLCNINEIHSQPSIQRDHCVLTQIGTFVNTLNVQLPFFGTILFYANLLFLGAFLISSLVVMCCKPTTYKKLEEDAFLDA